MDLFLSIEAFVATAEERSFRAGAGRLGMTPAGVSKAVARLEDELAVRLLDRTTRSVALTREGEIYLAHCQRAVAEMYAGRQRVEQAHRLCRGELVVALSTVMGASLASNLATFTQLYPGRSVRLVFDDRPSRLVDEQIDVALRIGRLSETREVALKLGELSWVTVASPEYLQRRGYPTKPDDLHHHDCLGYRSPGGQDVAWTFASPNGSESSKTFHFEKRMITNDGRVLIDAARGGVGVAHVFSNLIEADLKLGTLVRVLSDFSLPGPPLHALCKPGQESSPKIRAFFDFLRVHYLSKGAGAPG